MTTNRSVTAQPAPWARARSSREGREHQTRSALIEAAAITFARLGYARTTIADITAQAKVSRASFYLWFTTKAEIFACVAGRVRDDIIGVHESPEANVADPTELGRAATAAMLAAWSQHLDLMTVIEHQAISDPQIADLWQEIRQRPRRRMVRYVRGLVDAGRARPAASPEDVADAVQGMFEHFARRRLTDPEVFEQSVDALTAMYLRLLGLD